MKRYWTKIMAVFAALLIFSASVLAEHSDASSLFRDTASHWAKDYIAWAVEDKLTTGYPDGSFQPDKPIAEAEFLAMLLRSYSISQDFAAAGGSKWHHPYYNYAIKLNWPITFVNDSGSYNRGQAAQLLASAATGKAYSESGAIQWLLDEKLSNGRTSATVNGFEPKGTLTRAEALTFFYNLKQHTDKLSSNVLSGTAYSLKTIAINDTLDKLLITAGDPDRIDASGYGYSWYVYNKNYKQFILAGVQNNRIVALFSNASGAPIDWRDVTLETTLTKAKAALGQVQNIVSDEDYYSYSSNGIHSTLFLDNHDSSKIIGVLHHLSSAVKTVAYSNSLQEPYELLVLDLANAERARRGIATLAWDKSSNRVARAHSSDMVSRNFFSHTNPDGQSPFDRMDKAGIRYSAAAENIAYGYENPIFVHFGWMNSTTGHRETILSDKLERLGAGVAFKNNKSAYYTQTFSTAE